MKSLEMKIREQAKLKNTEWHIVEKDYALSYILAGISNEPTLSKSLIFKGGTALKKCYFGDYRFSEDLDFSTINAPKGEELVNFLLHAIAISNQYLNNHGPFSLSLSRKPERASHPNGQEAFNIQVKFPEHRSEGLCVIKLEITHDEPVISTPILKPLLHGYNENLECYISCYDIEEIIAEKLRALLQTHEKLVTRGWNRPRARDYYDLWNILKNYSQLIERQRLKHVLQIKCAHRNVKYLTINDFFTSQLTNEAHKHWATSLHLQVHDLPDCTHILNETNILINDLLF